MSYYTIITQHFLHALILLSILGGLFSWGYVYKKNKSKRDRVTAPILFLLHALTFFILISFNILNEIIYIFWRDLIFLHALIIFLTMGILEIKARED